MTTSTGQPIDIDIISPKGTTGSPRSASPPGARTDLWNYRQKTALDIAARSQKIKDFYGPFTCL